MKEEKLQHLIFYLCSHFLQLLLVNAGWIGKAISVELIRILVPPNTNPDQIFVVVANVIASREYLDLLWQHLTAALMSTVDTLINATAAVYINDVHRPTKEIFKA